MALALSGLSFDGGTTWVESEDRLVTYLGKVPPSPI